MKPVFAVLAKVNVHKPRIKDWGFVFWTRPNQAHTYVSKSYPALLFIPLFFVMSQAQTVNKGTIIIAQVTTTEIAIAADSQANKGGKNAGRHYCKLVDKNGYVFGVSGFPSYEETGFDVLSVLTAARLPTFTQTVERAEESLKRDLLRTLKYIWQNHRSTYIREINTSVTSFLVATMVGKTPRFAWRQVEILEDSITREPQSLHVKERIDCPGCGDVIVIGDDVKANEVVLFYNQYGQSLPEEFPSRVNEVEFLATFAAVVRKDVGTPIDVVRITKDGVKWIKRKPRCEEKKTKSN